MASDLDSALRQVRSWKSSKLPLQAKQAGLLLAIETALQENAEELSPAAYFASLVSVLDQSAVLDAASSLLALITPHVSQGLICSKLDVLVSKLAPLIVDANSAPALIRSGIVIFEAALVAQDEQSWSSQSDLGSMRLMNGLLALAQDPRPKVRKRAIEAIAKILQAPPAPHCPQTHPALPLCASTALKSVQDADGSQQLLHSLDLLKAIAGVAWPTERLGDLCETLLTASKSSNQFVLNAVFAVFGGLFASLEVTKEDSKSIRDLFALLPGLAPSVADRQLAPSWFAMMAQALGSYASIDEVAAFEAVPDLLRLFQPYLLSTAEEVAQSAAQGFIAVISDALKPELVLNADGSSKVLHEVGEILFELLHVKYHRSWQETCSVFVAFLDAVQWRAPVDKSIRVIGALRSDERLSASRENTDSVIVAAVRALGPERVLELIPLQLNVSSTDVSTGRAWMLPLLREGVQRATLAHFVGEMVPLADHIEKISSSMQNPRNAKILMTVVDQIWHLLPCYCDLPKDTTQSLTKEFVQRLMALLYNKPEYRPRVAQGLRLLVQSNLVYSQGALDDPLVRAQISLDTAKDAVNYIASEYAVDILKVLFNVFTKTTYDGRGYLLDTINAFLAVIDPSAVREIFNMVSSVLAENLTSDNDMALTMMDIVVAIAPYLPEDSYGAFHALFKTVAAQRSALLQKKAFRAFTRFVETRDGTIFEQEDIQEFMIKITDRVPPAARRTHLQALGVVVDALPDDELYFIPTVLSEVLLSLKDNNERTREHAFDLLLKMARRMQQGGYVDHSKMPDIADDQKTDASVDEYLTMITAGLLGTTPHMISATITALSFLLHKLRRSISSDQVMDLTETVWMLLDSKNREIIKSVLGFVKVSVLTLPKQDLEPRLGNLLENLMGWSTDHKNHFKAKVKHIVERLLNRFGFESLAAVFPQSDFKLLQNIHKSKERSKRKKEAGNDDGEGDESVPAGRDRRFEDELDEALYGSGSESESESEEDEPPQKGNGKAKGRDQFILNTDEPLNLLDQSALAQISSSKPRAAPKKQLKHAFKEKNGKLLIQEDGQIDLSSQDALSAYADAVNSGLKRTARGTVKFKKTKENDEDDDDDAEVAKKRKIMRPKSRLPKRRPLK